MMSFTPREIVSELDKYIIGQEEAKKAVAVAIRNRWRRQQVPDDIKNEIYPKNIIMIGPTGVGKTEIARRLAKIAQAPFVKVEASKFTEVGYVGRDVDSMVRDLVEVAVKETKERAISIEREKAYKLAEDKVLEALFPHNRNMNTSIPFSGISSNTQENKSEMEKNRELLRSGEFDDRIIELDVQVSAPPPIQMLGMSNMEDVMLQMQDILSGLMPKKGKKRKLKVKEALRILTEEEAQKLIDMDKVTKEALFWAEHMGIIFIDEIDKIAGRESGHGPDVSREGVQRDLLPIVEGSTVLTKYGTVKTDHILFIAAGAFNVAKPSDLIPELQGRFPIRVELNPLGKNEFLRILKEPKNSLIRQYKALLEAEGVQLEFTDDALDRISEFAFAVNQRSEDIGARRLYTVMEKLLEDLNYNAPELLEKRVVIDRDYVDNKLDRFVNLEDLSKYIL
ncbi:MAG: ATP-dependent protease ATPase subunit HslU [Deltaproteobacteria bacterium]|nr:ATP-dependent protease ATPase subunit HslU [Deltaproteobacteria bacterium]